MDLEQLEKLNELKEKGILSQEEFEKKKKELLNDSVALQVKASNPSQKKGVNWKNVGLCFLGALLYFIITIVIVTTILYFAGDDSLKMAFSRIINIICGIILAVIGKKLNMSQYKGCTAPWVAVIGMLFFGPLYFWFITYKFLQIKQGHAVLKDK